MPQLHRRVVAAAAVASAFALGGTGAAVASAAADAPATYPSAPTALTAPTAPGTMPGHAMFGGLFHALFDVFGAVRAQAPAIAAPVISDAVTAGTITPTEGDQLTAMFASLGTPPAAPTGTGTGTDSPATPSRPSFSAGQRTVLHAVADAIRTQLVTIATPVLDADVTAGTITAQQETIILGVLARVAAPHTAPAIAPAAPASAPADPAAALQRAVTHKVVAKALKAHRHAGHKSTRKAAAHR